MVLAAVAAGRAQPSAAGSAAWPLSIESGRSVRKMKPRMREGPERQTAGPLCTALIFQALFLPLWTVLVEPYRSRRKYSPSHALHHLCWGRAVGVAVAPVRPGNERLGQQRREGVAGTRS